MQGVNIEEVITLLLSNGQDPSAMLHLGDPETDQLLVDTGVILDRPHRTLLRAAIRAHDRELRARAGFLSGWESGQSLRRTAASTGSGSAGERAKQNLAQWDNGVKGSAYHEFIKDYEKSTSADLLLKMRERELNGHVKDQKLQMQAFLELRDEKEWWSWFNKGLQNPSNDTQQQVTPVEHSEHPIDTVGQITREEWIERYGTDKDFDTYDTDGNGIVDAEEFRPQPESAKLNNTPTACSLGGNGTFILTCNVITRGGTTQQVLEVSPQDLVADVLARASPQFMAEMRHKGEFDKQPHDLSLLDAGFSREMDCDIQVQCVPRPLEQNVLYNQSLA